MIVDAHCHLGPSLEPDRLIRAMDRSGVDRAVIMPEAADPALGRSNRARDVHPTVPVRGLLAPWNFLARFRYSGLVQDGMLQCGGAWRRIRPNPDNGPIAAALARHGDRFIGFAFVNPTDPGHLAALDRHLGQGFRGIKVQAWLHGVDLSRHLYAAARISGDAGFPVMVHLGGTYRTGLSILDLADRLPTTRFILTHAGLPYYSILWQAARRHPNLFFDLSGPFVSESLVRLAAKHVAPGRLLFASGGASVLRQPDGEMGYERVLGWFESLGLSGEARQAVYGENLLRLVGLGQARGRPSAASGNHGGR